MVFNVRSAVKEDMPQVLELIKELAVFEKEPDGVKISINELEEEGFGENPLFHCFVAEVASKIVGTAIIYFTFSTWRGRIVHLEDLIVTEAMRGKGIGEALYGKVMNYAHAQKVKSVQWIVLDWNEGAIKFYERSGATLYKNWYIAAMDKQSLENYVNSH